MSENPEEKIVEKHYIEVSPSAKQRLIIGLIGGLGWGVGLTIGTAFILTILGLVVSKIDFLPILGKFLADVIKESQNYTRVR